MPFKIYKYVLDGNLLDRELLCRSILDLPDNSESRTADPCDHIRNRFLVESEVDVGRGAARSQLIARKLRPACRAGCVLARLRRSAP